MIKAIVKTLTAGYPMEAEEFQQLGWSIGDSFEVESISVGGFSSTIIIDGKEYNSVFFDFEEDGVPLNIYSDSRFAQYSFHRIEI